MKRTSILVLSLSIPLTPLAAPAPDAPRAEPSKESAQPPKKLDHSGRRQKGKVSYYASTLSGRKMADGTRMDPKAPIAASKTLPLGTTAKVTNLENGKSAVVEIKDRGPYVKGRIVDVSPSVADKLDLKKDGVAPAEVAPIEVPQRDGSVKAGAGAVEKQNGGERK
jgi:rare lipoprotein A